MYNLGDTNTYIGTTSNINLINEWRFRILHLSLSVGSPSDHSNSSGPWMEQKLNENIWEDNTYNSI